MSELNDGASALQSKPNPDPVAHHSDNGLIHQKFSLLAIAGRVKTQDNRITANPIFEVQERKRVYGIDADFDPEFEWMDDSGEPLSEEFAAKLQRRFDRTGRSPKGVRRIGYRDEWVYVQPFFTLIGAERYVEENGHNHRRELRIYAGSAFRNHEWIVLRNFFLGLADGVVPDEIQAMLKESV